MPSCFTLQGLFLLALCALTGCQAKLNITFQPDPIIVRTESVLRVNVTVNETGPVPSGSIRFTVKDRRIADLPMENETVIPWVENSGEGLFQLSISGVRLGWTNLYISYVTNATNTTRSDLLGVTDERLTVLREQKPIQTVYRVILITFVIILVFGMGCTIDINVVLKLVKRPVGLAVGWCTQFILMPHLGVAVGQLLLLLVTDLDNTVAFSFGILTLACSPGGGSSNMWTLLFDGDLDLSMTMTFVSQVSALFMMPLWLFAYSRLYIDVNSVQIPFDQVAFNLLQLVIPVLLGVALKVKFPNIAHRIARYIKPFTLIFVLFVVGFGTYVNLFLFELIVQMPILIPFAALLPWLGFLVGFLVTTVLRLGRKQAVAIALEAGIQNVGIPILVLQFSMPKPDGDLAAIVPLIVVLVTPVPLYFVLAGMKIRQRLNRNRQYAMESAESAGADGSGEATVGTDGDKAGALKSGLTVDMTEHAQIQYNKSTDNLVKVNGQ